MTIENYLPTANILYDISDFVILLKGYKPNPIRLCFWQEPLFNGIIQMVLVCLVKIILEFIYNKNFILQKNVDKLCGSG